MMIQEAMKKPTKGDTTSKVRTGWTHYRGANDEYSAWTRTDTESSFLVPTEETLLDP